MSTVLLEFSIVLPAYNEARNLAKMAARLDEVMQPLGRIVDFAVTGIVAHSIRPLRIAIYLSLIFASLGLLLLVYSLVSFLWVDHTMAGWPSIMATIAILAAVQFLVLGIVGEYVGRILRQTRKWPVYIVATTEAHDAVAEMPPVVTPYPRGTVASKGG